MQLYQVLLVTLLSLNTVVFAFAQDVKGNGNVVKQEREIQPFSKLKIGGVLNVYLSQGDTESLTIEADENLLDMIETINRGDKLTIRLKEGIEIKKAKQKNIYLTLKNIDDLEIGGVVNVETTTPLQVTNLDVEIGGVSNTDLDLRCETLTADAQMVGTLTLRGEVQEADIKNAGVGNLKAYDLKVDRLTIKNSGVGSAEVYAQDEISITASGVGSVRYKGDPTVKELNTSGMGKVKKI